MSHLEIELHRVVSAPFEENTYILRMGGRDDCLVIDPGFEPQRILEHLDAQKLVPAAILNTHGHVDHIAGNGALKERWPDCPLAIGVDEAAKLTDPRQNLSAAFGTPLASPPADVTLVDGQVYSAAGFDLEVRVIPGHSTGHVVFLWQGQEPAIVFVGDVIFFGSVGRTDFPDGSFDQLAEGIRQKLFTLPDETVLLPGHGPRTFVGREKRNNPFLT